MSVFLQSSLFPHVLTATGTKSPFFHVCPLMACNSAEIPGNRSCQSHLNAHRLYSYSRTLNPSGKSTCYMNGGSCLHMKSRNLYNLLDEEITHSSQTSGWLASIRRKMRWSISVIHSSRQGFVKAKQLGRRTGRRALTSILRNLQLIPYPIITRK